jgi:hypothetical protein
MRIQARSRMLSWVAGFGLSLPCLAQNSPRVLPVPADPLELVTGPVETAQDRYGLLQLLQHAHENFALRGSEKAYDLKVKFTVDSLGQTNYDGSWEMEDVNVPGRGLHWTAKSNSGYAVDRISIGEGIYAKATTKMIPLRLHEVRGLLNDPLPSASYAGRGSIRVATVSLNGAGLTCLLLSHSQNPAIPASGRAWEEAEECIDPQTGLLQIHSEVPGLYAVYDYSNPFQLGAHVLPRSITVSEAGRIISRISVESATPVNEIDQSRFVPNAELRAEGSAIGIKTAERLIRVHRPANSSSATVLRAVCVFGVVSPAGQLVEAHSLQPSDPNSQAAVRDAMNINFSAKTPQATGPEQHFVFVIEKFFTKQ